jgi:hypothetical protein
LGFHSPKAIPSDMVSVAIRPNVRVVDGELSASHLELLTKWVELNSAALGQYWDGEIEYTGDIIEVLRPLKT